MQQTEQSPSIFRTPDGLEDSGKYPNLFAALIEDGWTDEELGKLASGNLIRVFKEVEAVRDSLASEEPYQAWIPKEDLTEGESQQDHRKVQVPRDAQED